MSIEEFLSEWHDASDRLLVHTSGSTGEPKALWVEKRRMEASARITCSFLGLKPGDTALLCMPLDYIAGKMMVVRALTCGLRLFCTPPTGHPLAAGNSLSVVETTSSAAPPQAFHLSSSIYHLPSDISHLTSSISHLVAMVPMQVFNTLQVPAERERLMRVRHLIIGGGAIDDALEAELRTFPNAVWSTYGMTETLSHIALRRISGPEASDWYTPFPTVDVSLNADGCLVIDAPEVCPDALETNDRAELSPDGRRFRILGRRDNVICSGGVKIQIEEVERMLRPHLPFPYMVTRLRDAKFGEAVVLLMQSADVAFARSVCRRVLPRYWQPKHYIPAAALPMTATGKPARKKAEQYAAEYNPIVLP